MFVVVSVVFLSNVILVIVNELDVERKTMENRPEDKKMKRHSSFRYLDT